MKPPVKITGEIKGTDDLASSIRKISKGLVTRDLLGELSSRAKEVILERTDREMDYSVERFRPYSKGWSAERAKKGKTASVVDLSFEGKMLGDIKAGVDITGGEARVYFANPGSEGKKALYHNVTGAGGSKIRREFFGLGEGDGDVLEKIVFDHIRGLLKRV